MAYLKNKNFGLLKIFACLFFIFIFCRAYPQDETIPWQTEKSQHFIINYKQASSDFLSELVYRAENYYNGIMDDLGYLRFDFWSWDERAKIFLYNNSDEYHKSTLRENWSGAIVSVSNRTITSFIGQPGFFDSILPHEMAHIIFREFVGGKTVLPLWIDEGVACSRETSYLAGRIQLAKNAISQNKYIKLDKLSQIYKLSDETDPQIFYSEAASIINFLISRYGKDSFLDFSRKLKDGTGWQKALFSVYGFENTDEFENAWKNFVLKN